MLNLGLSWSAQGSAASKASEDPEDANPGTIAVTAVNR